MSRLSEMIKKLCPNGVEYKRLGEVAKICRGVRVVRKELVNYGKYAVYQNSLKPLGFYNEANVKGGTAFVIGAGAAGEVGYSDSDFWAADDCYYIDGGDQLIGRYVYYCLTSRQGWLESKTRKASIPRLSRDFVAALEIPLPPLEIQCEIVQILDNFANLTAELTAELAKRKKQYEHYRDMLLTGAGDWEVKKLADICNFVYGYPFDATMFNSSGQGTPLVRIRDVMQSNTHTYTTEEFQEKYRVKDGDLLVGMDGDFNLARWHGVDAALNQRVCMFKPDETKVLLGFLAHDLCYFIKAIWDRKSCSTVKHLSAADLNSIKIPLPPLAEQKRIVAILDRFDALCNSLSEGLPAEIELRKKQYEYYRDKLLSFKEAG